MSSIYRRNYFPMQDENDVRKLEGSKPATAAEPTAPVAPTSEPRDWKLHRRGEPANVLLPTTRRWAESIPEPIRPHALLRLFPRIANRLANAWDDRPSCRIVFEELLVDRRSGRRGFPPEVTRDLLELRAHFLGDAPLMRYPPTLR